MQLLQYITIIITMKIISLILFILIVLNNPSIADNYSIVNTMLYPTDMSTQVFFYFISLSNFGQV